MIISVEYFKILYEAIKRQALSGLTIPHPGPFAGWSGQSRPYLPSHVAAHGTSWSSSCHLCACDNGSRPSFRLKRQNGWWVESSQLSPGEGLPLSHDVELESRPTLSVGEEVCLSRGGLSKKRWCAVKEWAGRDIVTMLFPGNFCKNLFQVILRLEN